jgi:Flp pilus assembly protein TadG
MGATRLRRATGPQAGSATAELVIATPALLLMVMLVVQFALWQHGQHVATAAAEEGERAARLQGGTAEAGAARARQFLTELGPHLVVAPKVTARRDAATARVEVVGSAEPLVPWLRLPIHAVAQGPLEQFTPAVPAAGGPP